MVKMKFGVATRPASGSKYNGDMHFIKEFDHKVFISLIDGLGHGEFAAIASSKCIRCVGEHYQDNIPKIFGYCDTNIRRTNGVVMGILSIDLERSTISYAGVGNISAGILSKSIHFISRDGIVGYRLPKIKEYKATYTPGDTILMYTDGISSKVVLYPSSRLEKQDVQEAADEIMRLFGKDKDDATVIVAR